MLMTRLRVGCLKSQRVSASRGRRKEVGSREGGGKKASQNPLNDIKDILYDSCPLIHLSALSHDMTGN